MPQLDPTTFAPQLVWLAITFVLLYVLMATVGLPKVRKALDERQNKIDADLAAAQTARAQSEAVLAAYEKDLTEARHKAAAQVQEQLAKASATAAQREHEATARLMAEAAAAEARIAEVKSAALANLREVAADVARDAATRLLGFAPDEALLTHAVDSAMKGHG